MKKRTRTFVEYHSSGLTKSDICSNPVEQFDSWYTEALQTEVMEANIAMLATADNSGKPSNRTLLLKEYGDAGFSFFSNYESRKARELEQNPFGSLLFFWYRKHRQVRIEGMVRKLETASSDEYFKSRPRKSKLAAWASKQSSEIISRYQLEKQYNMYEKKFDSQDAIPRPPFWGGYLLTPYQFEFWQGRENRMHDRILYEKDNGNWNIKQLAP
jgi:pyridoxamine 5'-phosphate oxidase